MCLILCLDITRGSPERVPSNKTNNDIDLDQCITYLENTVIHGQMNEKIHRSPCLFCEKKVKEHIIDRMFELSFFPTLKKTLRLKILCINNFKVDSDSWLKCGPTAFVWRFSNRLQIYMN